jgi:hypothetical protein
VGHSGIAVLRELLVDPGRRAIRQRERTTSARTSGETFTGWPFSSTKPPSAAYFSSDVVTYGNPSASAASVVSAAKAMRLTGTPAAWPSPSRRGRSDLGVEVVVGRRAPAVEPRRRPQGADRVALLAAPFIAFG